MTAQEFKTALYKFKFYMKPSMFTALAENCDAFSDETRTEIIEKLEEADNQMKELYEYQQQREGILKKGLDQISGIYDKVKGQYEQYKLKEQATDVAEAGKLLTNI